MERLQFISSLMAHDWARLQNLSMILAIFYLCVLGSIFVDLASGVEKAKRNGVCRTSYGFRRTINKIKDYFSVLMLFTIADVVASVWFSLPFFTAIGTIAMVFIEAKSVYENKRDANKGIKDLPDVLVNILKSRDNVSEIIDIFNKLNESRRNENERDRNGSDQEL